MKTATKTRAMARTAAALLSAAMVRAQRARGSWARPSGRLVCGASGPGRFHLASGGPQRLVRVGVAGSAVRAVFQGELGCVSVPLPAGVAPPAARRRWFAQV